MLIWKLYKALTYLNIGIYTELLYSTKKKNPDFYLKNTFKSRLTVKINSIIFLVQTKLLFHS